MPKHGDTTWGWSGLLGGMYGSGHQVAGAKTSPANLGHLGYVGDLVGCNYSRRSAGTYRVPAYILKRPRINRGSVDGHG